MILLRLWWVTQLLLQRTRNAKALVLFDLSYEFCFKVFSRDRVLNVALGELLLVADHVFAQFLIEIDIVTKPIKFVQKCDLLQFLIPA